MKIADMQIVITGASGGIGQASALLLGRLGARIIAVGRDGERLQQLICRLPSHPEHPHLYYCCDLNDAEQRKKLISELWGLDPAPNVLINMAGCGAFGLFEEQTAESIEQLVQLNITNTLLLTQGLLPLLQHQQQARILNVGSILGSIGHPGYVSYCTSKFALRGFSEALQRELSDTGVRVQYLAPRATRTGFNSDAVDAMNAALNNRADDAEQVAEALVELLKDQGPARYLGWPEKLFVRINALFPSVVGNALQKQLPIIKEFARKGLKPEPVLTEERQGEA